jgi:hypothetical protein
MGIGSRLKTSYRSRDDLIVESDENNLGEMEFMLENERKKFREAK